MTTSRPLDAIRVLLSASHGPARCFIDERSRTVPEANQAAERSHISGGALEERLGIAGAGTIACGLAVAAARVGEVMLWARSAASADRARNTVAKTCARLKDEG